MRLATVLAALALVVGPGLAMSVSAQPIGSFRWQLQPYCNIINLAVVQQGGEYQLDGTDDQCGAEVSASVVGRAFQNPNGSIGFGMSVVTAPGGRPVHVDATIALSSLNGTWRDSAGNTGSFVFTPGASIGGAPRPVPSGGLAPGSVTTVQLGAASVTAAQLAPNAVTGAAIANGSITSADLLAPPRAGYASSEQQVTLTSTPATIRSVALSIPSPGRVIANATMTVGFLGATSDTVQCSLAATPTFDLSQQVVADDAGATLSSTYSPLAITRGFDVTAGTFTVYLVCQEFSGNTEIRNSSVTAMFVGS